jgi:hypothetical protein
MRDPERAETRLAPEPESASCAQFEGDSEYSAPFTEAEETELAGQLLKVRDPRQFDQFLGGLIQRAAGGVRPAQLGRALGGILKGVARSALPAVGLALGGPAPVGRRPPAGGSPFDPPAGGEDREFESARRFVRFAGAAAKRAVRTPARAPPTRTARDAVVLAARRHAPRLLTRRSAPRTAVRTVSEAVSEPVSEPATDTATDTASEPSVHVCGTPSVEKCSCGRLIRAGRKVVVINL